MNTGPTLCAGCTEEVCFEIDHVYLPTGGSLAGMQPKLSASKRPRLTCPQCGWQCAVLSMRPDGVLSVRELSSGGEDD